MSDGPTPAQAPQVPAEERLGPFTWRQVLLALFVWLALFALVSAIVDNPFRIEVSAAATPDYGKAMFFHGLLVGLAAVVSLTAASALELRSRGVRVFLLGSSLLATVLAGVGGVFDRSVTAPGFWLGLHIVGFFLLDATFVALLVGVVRELRAGPARERLLPLWAAGLAALSLEFAALMGHLAGWMLDFGDHPALLGQWARWVGEDFAAMQGNLVTSHSHEIVVALLALLVVTVAWRFGYGSLRGAARQAADVGLWLVTAGTVAMTLIYVVGGITSLQPPLLFAFGSGGVNGIAGDDLVTGVGVMLGGLVLVLALLAGRSKRAVGREAAGEGRLTLGAIVWGWLLLVASVVGGGYYIELNETVFGVGNPKASGAASDAVFTFAHQDFAFFLVPALIITLIVADLALNGRARTIALWIAGGEGVAFAGFWVYVFGAPSSLHGTGYALATLGLVGVWIGLVVFLYGLWRAGTGVALPTSQPIPASARADV